MSGMDRFYKRQKEKESTSAVSSASGGMDRYYKKQYYNTLDTSGVDDNYLKTFVSEANSFISCVGENKLSYTDVNSKLSDLSSRYDTVSAWLYKNKANLDEKSYKDISSALGTLKSGFDSVRNYYSQWASDEDYNKYLMGWLDSEAITDETTTAQRKAQYQSNADRIAEIDEDLPFYAGSSWVPNFMENWFLSDEQEATRNELEARKAENKQYERTQKAIDDYYVPVTDEFLKNASYRDYKNATREELWNYNVSEQEGSLALNSGGYFDDEGNIRDSDGNIVQYANAPTVEDKLGLFLSTNEDERTEAYNELLATNGNYTNTWANLIQDGDVNGWAYLTENEVNIYYDLYKREGQEAAYRYLDAMTTELTRRATQETTDYINNAEGLEQVFLNAASIPMNVFGGAFAFVDDVANVLRGEDINPYSRAHSFQNAATDIRSKTAADIDEWTGGVAIPLIDFSVGDTYQALMSGADSMLGVAIGGNAYGVLMGMGAASSTAKDLYTKGATTEQIVAGSLLAGAAEMVFEKYSIDKLVEGTDAKSIKDIIVNMLTQGGVEATEEMATEIANTITNYIVMGEQSDWVDLETFVKNVVNAGLGGFISGGGMAGIYSTAQKVVYDQQVKEYGRSIIDQGGVEDLQATASKMTENKAVAKLIDKVAKNTSAKNVGKLAATVQNVTDTNDKVNMVSELVDKGLSKREAKKVADFVTELSHGYEPSSNEIAEIEKITDKLPDVVDTTSETATIRDSRTVETVQPTEETVQTPAVATQETAQQKEIIAETESVPVEENATEAVESANAVKADDRKSDDRITEIASAKGGAVMVRLDNGEVVNANEVNFGNEDVGLVYQAAADMSARVGGFNEDTVRVFVKGFDPNAGITAAEYVYGFRDAYRYGAEGAPVSELARGEFTSKLTEEQRTRAFHFGRAFGNEKVSQAQAKLDARKANASDNALKSDFRNAKMDSKSKNGGDKIEAEKTSKNTKTDSEKTSYFDGDRSALTERQRSSIEFLERVFGDRGVRFIFFASYADENGNRVYKNSHGQIVPAPNGQYNPDGSIMIDINAGQNGEGLILNTASHELTHFIKAWSPEKFRIFAEFLLEQYGKSNIPVEAFVQRKIKNAKANGRTINRGVAYEEIVADSCEMMLVDIINNKDQENLQKLLAKDRTLFEKIKDFFTELLERIKAAYKGVDPQSLEGAYVREMRDVADILQTVWTEVLVDAMNTYEAVSNGEARDSADTKFSDRDSAYMDAVHRGDMESAQMMVDEAAKKADYTIKSYHGTLAKDFTEFKKSFIGSRFNYDDKGFFFIDRKSIAEDYSTSEFDRNKKGRVLSVFLRVRSPLLVNKQFCLREGLGNPFREDDAIGVWDAYLEYFKEEAESKEADGIIIDDGMSKMTVVFDPNQIKSADPVTYDDNGNVIPLSERFNIENNDIRYSDRDSDGNILTKGQREFFKDSKVRDESGNLLVVYHGTRKADFTKFNRNYNFFTDSAEMADSYAPNGERYTGYLNIKNPYVIDAEGEKWSRIPIDEETKQFLDKYGASTFEEDGIWRTTPADIASAIEEGIDEGEFDYDGIIINNIDDTGSYYKSRDNVIANDYITFDSNQFKNTDNKTPTSDPDIRYSLRGTNEDGIEVFETSEEIKKLPYKERQKVFLDIMKNQYRGRTAKFIRNGHAYYALFEEGDVRKNIYGDKLSDIKGRKAKINVGADGDIFELVENAKYDGSKPESGKKIASHKNVEYWDYFVKIVQIDNRVFDLVANVRKKPDNSFVYNIQLKENKKIKASPPRSSLLRASSGVPNASVDFISQNAENVNSEFSEKDSEGNSLTKVQSEFFRDSKARDKDGNLLVLYHGTANAGFTVFEPSRGKYGGSWFTTSQKDADSYAGNYKHKLFDPAETDDIRTATGGNYMLGSWMRFDTAEDRAEFLRNNPNAETVKTDAEYDELLKAADKARDWDEYDRLEAEQSENRAELKKIQRAYGRYEWEHSRIATLGEVFANPERFSKSDIIRAYDAYDANNTASDEEYTKEDLIAGLKAENDRLIEEDGMSIEDLTFKARLPVGDVGEIVNYANNRTYAVYANVTNPYVIEAYQRTLAGAGLYSRIEDGMNDAQYDGVIVRNARVGAYEEIGDVVIIKKPNQIKLTSNPEPDASDDIRYSDRDNFYDLKRELKEKYGVDTESVLTLADGYLQNYGGVLNKAQFRVLFLDIAFEVMKSMQNSDGEIFNRVNEKTLETASEIVNNPAISGELVDELRKIKRHIKDIRIKIPNGRKGDFDIFGGFEAFRRKHFNKLTLTNDGVDVDAIYPELQELFGRNWFPDNIYAVSDQLIKIAEVVDTPLSEMSENYYDTDEAMIEVAGEIFDKVQTIALNASENAAHINYRDADSVSPRAMLANALESAAQNDFEKNKLKNYKEKIGKINAEERKLQHLRQQLRELSFASGPRDTAKISELRVEAEKSANRIGIYDKQLLELEASKPLRDVLQREKHKAYKKAEEEAHEAMVKYKARAAKMQEELKKRYQESQKRGTENRRRTVMRHKIRGVVGELNNLLLHGSKNRNVKLGLQEAVAAALEAVNMDTLAVDERIAKYNELIAKATDADVIASLTKTRDNIRRQGDVLGDKLEAMRKAYRDIREKDKNGDYPDYLKAEAKLIENRIESVIDTVGNTPLRNMSYKQLDAVYDMYKMVLATVRNANAVFKEGKIEDLQKNVNSVMTELSAIPKLSEERSAVSDVLRGYVVNELVPYNVFSLIGSKTFESFYWEAIKGQDVYARDISEAQDFASKTRGKYHYDTWDFDKIHEFKLADGRTFSVSLKHMMSVYAYSKRDQASAHMQKGGFFFNDKETFRKKGGVLKMIRDSEAGYKIDKGALAAIVSAMTEEQRGYVDDMQAYMTQMGEKGNEVTRTLWGIELFKEKVYFPLKSSKDFIYQANQPVQESSLKNDGMTKETKPGASNPIILEAFDDVWANHIHRMSQYHAYVLPIENLNKILNYGTWANTDAVAVSTMLRSRYGSAVNDYLNQFIGDLNGVKNSQGAIVSAFSGMLSKFKKTSVAGSLSVVVQQPTAILRAQALIDAKYFVGKPNMGKLSSKWEEIKKYAPIAIIKDIGGFEAGAGRQTTEWLNADTQRGLSKVLSKIDDITMMGAALGDKVGWCTIWEAVKRETLSKHRDLAPTSDEFLRLAGERFTEVIVKTQVYDSTLSRSGYMRSKNELTKMMTSFMGEPTVSANMLYDAVIRAKRGTISMKEAARTIGAVYLSVVAATLAKSLIYALRDDDEDESYLEKYMQALGGAIINDINPLTWLPGVRDILSIFDGWEVERTDMALFQDLKNAIDGLDSDSKSTWRKIEDFSGAVAAFFGLPLKNVMRTAREVYNGFENMLDGISGGNFGEAFLEGVTGKNAGKSKGLYDAIVGGDEDRLAIYREEYESEDAYNTALRKALRENDPRIKEAAEARYNGDIGEYMRIAKEIIEEGNFSQDNIVSAINSVMSAIKKAEETGSEASITQTESDKVESIYSVDDFYKAIRGYDIATAYAVREDIINVAIENGEDREDAEKAFEGELTSYVGEQYKYGSLSDADAADMLINYGGKTEEEASSKVRYWAFKLEYPEYEDLSEPAINKYYDGSYKNGELYGKSAESYGISLEVYAEYIREKSGLTKKEDIMYVINTLPLSSHQKDALYYLNNYAESTIDEAPWR